MNEVIDVFPPNDLFFSDALGAYVEFQPYDFLVDNPVTDFSSGGTWVLTKDKCDLDLSVNL